MASGIGKGSEGSGEAFVKRVTKRLAERIPVGASPVMLGLAFGTKLTMCSARGLARGETLIVNHFVPGTPSFLFQVRQNAFNIFVRYCIPNKFPTSG